MMEECGIVVIGAGVVGLAVTRALAEAGYDVVIAEKETSIGAGVSSRNSEVIHAGIYYPHGSLKARLCVEGKKRLYAYCRARHIAHRQCGKLIVAADASQTETLDRLAQAARGNGVTDLERLSGAQARAMEPALSCAAALYSPSTGIIDSHALMLSLLGDAEAAGASLAFGACVSSIAAHEGAAAIAFDGDDEPVLKARLVVNCAGLDAPALADAAGAPAPKAYLAKGSYYALQGRSPFSRLIYPVPEPGGLGVHLTLDLAGAARFGPDVEWVETRDFDVDPARAERFYDSVRRYWPGLRDGALVPAYSGIRPKISGPGEANADFVISPVDEDGRPPMINLFGIESPGLTSCLAMAQEVLQMVQGGFDA